MTLVNATTGTTIETTHGDSVGDGKTVLRLGFADGPSVVSGAVAASMLADGNYQLRVHADSISAISGNSLDGDSDGVGGDDYVTGGYDTVSHDLNPTLHRNPMAQYLADSAAVLSWTAHFVGWVKRRQP